MKPSSLSITLKICGLIVLLALMIVWLHTDVPKRNEARLWLNGALLLAIGLYASGFVLGFVFKRKRRKFLDDRSPPQDA